MYYRIYTAKEGRARITGTQILVRSVSPHFLSAACLAMAVSTHVQCRRRPSAPTTVSPAAACGGVGAHAAAAVVDGEEVVEFVQHLTCQKKRRLSTTTLFVAE